MRSLRGNRITELAVLRLLIGGFALVLLLLGAVGVIAIRGTRKIENTAAQAGDDQQAVVELIGGMRVALNNLASAVHEMVRRPQEEDDTDLKLNLDSAQASFQAAAAIGLTTPDAPRWKEIDNLQRTFIERVKQALDRPGAIPGDELSQFLVEHDRIVGLGRELGVSAVQRSAASGDTIEGDARSLASQSTALLGASLVLGLLCAGLTVVMARRNIRRIEWQAQELNRVSWQMLQSQEDTARRFSHELHDELGQSLAAVKSNLTSANPSDLLQRRADCVHLVDEAIANVRELSQLLRPVILDDFGLDASLRWLTERFSQRTGIETEYISTGTRRVAEDVETHLFRIAQEALTNIQRHSGARHVRAELEFTADQIHFMVEDDGKGLSTAASSEPSLGMIGMRARARQVGGELLVSASRNGGVRLDVEAPLTKPELNAEQQEDAYSVS